MKSIFSSKTVWLNVISFLILALTLPQFGAIVPTAWAAGIALVVALLNLILRVFFTSQPITQTAANN